jgi:serine/threonine protein kinase
MDQYEKGKELGRGTFGAVYAARRKSDGLEVIHRFTAVKSKGFNFVSLKVAIKRVHTAIGSDGVDFTALREILALTQCDCDNVLRLIDVFASKDKILLVMEQMALDLHKVITNKLFPLSLGYVKGYAVQMWRGLEHLHARWIAHRDIKVWTWKRCSCFWFVMWQNDSLQTCFSLGEAC